MIKEYTEYEAIHLAMREGLTDGSELQTKTYERLGYLRNDCILDAFIEKLKQGYETVELKLNPKSNKGKGDRPFAGKKRVYIIGGKRDTIIEREDRRKYNQGKPLSLETQVLYKIGQHKLYDLQSTTKNYTVDYWSMLLGFEKFNLDHSSKSFNYLVRKIRAAYFLHEDTDFFKANKVIHEFVVHYNKNVDTFIRSMFNRLNKDGKLVHRELYKGFIKDTNTAIDITKEVHNEFLDTRRTMMESSGYSHRMYGLYVHKWEKYQSMTEEEQDNIPNYEKEKILRFGEEYEAVNYHLKQMYEVDYVYTTHEIGDVAPLDPDELTEVSITMQQNYFNDEYIARRKRYNFLENHDNFINSTFFYRRFFYLTASILLDKTDNEQLMSFEKDLREFVEHFDVNYKFNQEQHYVWYADGKAAFSRKQRESWFKRREEMLNKHTEKESILSFSERPIIIDSEMIDSFEELFAD